jgi:O-antigen/teichoic acid export membrane protein
MIAGIFVARFAGPEVVGIISYATSYVMIFTIFFVFGPGHVKIMSEGKDIGNYLATYTWLQLGSFTAWFLIVLGWFLSQKYFFVNQFESQVQEIVILITLFATLFGYLLDFSNATFTGRLEQAKANYPLILKNLLYNIGRIAVVVLGFKAIALASLNLLTSLLLLPLAYKLFRTLSWGKWDWKLAKRYFAYGIPFLLSNFVDTITKYSDKLVLQRYTSTKELGYYGAALSIGGLIMIGGRSIAIVFFPLFSSLISENKWDVVNKKIKDFENFITTFIFPTICLLVIIGEPFIITLLGHRYEPSVQPFKLLLFSSYLTLVGMPYGNILAGMGRFYIGTWINLIKFFIYIVAIFIFVSPDFLGLGATGLALNLLVVNLFSNLLFFIISKRIGDVKVGFQNFFRHVIILAISVIFYLSIHFISQIGVLWWLALIPVYLIVVYGILLLTGFLTKEQLEQFIDLFKLKKTIFYFRDEVSKPGKKQ